MFYSTIAEQVDARVFARALHARMGVTDSFHQQMPLRLKLHLNVLLTASLCDEQGEAKKSGVIVVAGLLPLYGESFLDYSSQFLAPTFNDAGQSSAWHGTEMLTAVRLQMIPSWHSIPVDSVLVITIAELTDADYRQRMLAPLFPRLMKGLLMHCYGRMPPELSSLLCLSIFDSFSSYESARSILPATAIGYLTRIVSG